MFPTSRLQNDLIGTVSFDEADANNRQPVLRITEVTHKRVQINTQGQYQQRKQDQQDQTGYSDT